MTTRARHCATFFAAVFATVTATAAQAEGWRCDMTRPDRWGWISHRVEIHVSGGSARVLDSVIAETAGGPVAAQVTTDTPELVVVSWTARNVRVDAGLTVSRTTYIAGVNRKTGRISMRALFAVGDNIPIGTGQCRRVAGTGGFAAPSAPRRRIVVNIPEF